MLIEIGCTRISHVDSGNEEYLSLVLPLNQKEQIVCFSEIMDSLCYIPLETKEQCLIGSVDKLLLAEDDKFIVVDKDIASAIFIYDKSGSFIRQIGRRGLGDFEYVTIGDVTYGYGYIYVWDNSRKNILKYSMEGDLVNTWDFNYTAYSVCCIDEDVLAFCCDYTPNYLLSMEDSSPSLLIYDIKKQKIYTDLFFDSDMSATAYFSSLNNLYLGNLYLPLNDTIYKIDREKVNRKYVFQYSDHYLKNKNDYILKSKNSMISANEAEEAYLNGMYPHLITYFECDSVDVFFMRMSNYLYYGFYYPSIGYYREASSKVNPVQNDIDKIAVFSPRCSCGNIIFSLVDPADLLEHKNSFLGEIEKDSNPIIVKMYMKVK